MSRSSSSTSSSDSSDWKKSAQVHCCRKIEALVFLLANSMIVRQGMFFNFEKRRHARKCVIWPILGTSFSTNRHLLLPSLLNAKPTHAHMGCMLRHFVTWTIFHGPMGHGTCVLAEVLDWCWVLWSHPLQPRRHWCRGDPKQVRVKLMVKHGESNKTSWQQLKHIKTGSNIVVKSFIGCTLTPFFDQTIAVSLKAWFATHESLAFYVPPVVSDMDVFGVIYVSVHIMEGIILHHAPCQQGSCEWVRKKRQRLSCRLN